MQESEIVLDMFRALKLTPEQQQVAAESWRGWVRIRAALDRSVAVALEPLNSLLDLPDLMLECPATSEPHAVHNIERGGWLGTGADRDVSVGPPELGLSPGRPPTTRGPEVESKEAGARAPAAGTEGAAVQGHRICLCGGCVRVLEERMAGLNAYVTAAARRGVAALAGVHRREGEVAVEQLRAICMPGAIFTPEQYAHQTAIVLQQGALMDWFWLCKVAAAELQHTELFDGVDQRCNAV